MLKEITSLEQEIGNLGGRIEAFITNQVMFLTKLYPGMTDLLFVWQGENGKARDHFWYFFKSSHKIIKVTYHKNKGEGTLERCCKSNQIFVSEGRRKQRYCWSF